MMRLAFRPVFGTFFSCIALVALACPLVSQQPGASIAATAAAPLPEAPQALIAPEAAELPDQQSSLQQAPAQTPAAQGSSSSQTPAQQPDAEKSEHEKAEEQLKAQEHQRVMGVMATFNTTSNKDALPLSPKQKFELFLKSETDPWPFLLSSVVAGIGQADNSYPEWGQGVQGYAKRFGAAYSDAFIGNFFGNAVLPSLLREDPRYFQKGKGKVFNRILWAAGSSFWCKRDNGGWGPNWANVGGNFIGTSIARLYYPPSERNVKD